MSVSVDVATKAGHSPAVKAGGMRVARNHQSSTGESKEKNEVPKAEGEEHGTSPPKEEKKEVLVSGVLTKEEKAFPPEAIRHYHVKPLPTREMRPIQVRHTINQPK